MTSDEIEDKEEDAEMSNENLLNRPLNEEMKNSYINYAMSVIIGRALPDARDGLKPVPVSYTHLTLPTTPYV